MPRPGDLPYTITLCGKMELLDRLLVKLHRGGHKVCGGGRGIEADIRRTVPALFKLHGEGGGPGGGGEEDRKGGGEEGERRDVPRRRCAERAEGGEGREEGASMALLACVCAPAPSTPPTFRCCASAP